MPESSDTLIELKPDESEADGLVHVQADVSSMYPPTSVPPKFQISGLVVRYGRRFVRLSSLAGSLHMALPRWRRAQDGSPGLFYSRWIGTRIVTSMLPECL